MATSEHTCATLRSLQSGSIDDDGTNHPGEPTAQAVTAQTIERL
jgi:hypothetical protein